MDTVEEPKAVAEEDVEPKNDKQINEVEKEESTEEESAKGIRPVIISAVCSSFFLTFNFCFRPCNGASHILQVSFSSSISFLLCFQY